MTPDRLREFLDMLNWRTGDLAAELEPLYDSNDDFVIATQRLRVHKALYEEGDGTARIRRS